MEQYKRVIRSETPIKLAKLKVSTSQLKRSESIIKPIRSRITRSELTPEIVNKMSHADITKKASDFISFKPRTKYYVEISESPTFFDLRGKELEKDLNSFKKLVNYETILTKANDIHLQLKTFINKSANKIVSGRDTEANIQKVCSSMNFKFFKEVKNGNLESVVSLVKANPELVKQVDSTEQTALHWACKRGHTDIVKFLVECKANVLTRDAIGRKPNDIAIAKNHYDIVALLGANRRRTRHQTNKLNN